MLGCHEEKTINWLSKLFERLTRRDKQTLAVLTDCAALPVALWSALALRLGEWTPEVAAFWPAFLVSALVCIPVFQRLGLYRQVIRYMGNHAMWSVVKGATITAVAIAAVAYFVPLKGFPRSVPMIFWLLVLLYVSGTRFAIRAYFQWIQARLANSEAAIIYGAGEKGVELSRLLLQQGDCLPVAFIDDDVANQRRSIDGLYVHPPRALPKLLRESNATQVLVAVSADAAEQRRVILEYLEPFGVRVRLIPDITDLISGAIHLSSIRDVSIEDLLGRDEVVALPHLLERSVRNRCVLVTGAGGSIGSELCRQIVRQRPELLVVLDQSEYGLFEVHRELKALTKQESIETPVIAVLGSVTNGALMRRTLKRYQVTTVYHAAAYKHVNLVENNVIQGLKNNTFGTLHTAEAAMDSGVEDFILISTDKAVRTTSVMGASKRLAEMVLQALQQTGTDTRFSMVRFGNVLGSSGSVVPVFEEQIDRGGPVTVTHPDVTRYFMTIPEAAQLVLQAASMARGGDVFLLDMGTPIRIVDLATRMIHLKGHTVKDAGHPNGEIAIQFTGLNPGEKLHEELLVSGEVVGTEHPKILRAEERFVAWPELRGALNTLEQACDDFDYEAIKTFIEGLVEGADLESQLGDLSPRAAVLQLPTLGNE